MVTSAPVQTSPWPGNAHGLKRFTIPTAARFIVQGGDNPKVKGKATQILQAAGFPRKKRDIAQCVLDWVRKNFGYIEDQTLREWIQSAVVSLCLEDECIVAGDCDDHQVLMGALLRALGVDVKLALIENSGSQAHVLVVFQSDDGRWLEIDSTVPDRPIGHVSMGRKTLFDPHDPKVAPTDLPDGAFIGVGRAMVESGTVDPAMRLVGAGAITPGDVLAYRAMWNAYVVQTACALSVQAWAAGVQATTGTPPTVIDFTQPACECAGDVTPTDPNAQGWGYEVTSGIFDTSSFAMQPPSAALLNTFAQASADQAQSLLDQWNIESGLTDAQIVQAAPQILGSMQDTVVQCGRVFRPALVNYSPGLAAAIAPGADTSLQKQVIAQLEGANIELRGKLDILQTGVGGVIIAANKAVGQAGTVVFSPWLWGAIGLIAASAAVVSVAYVYKTSTAPLSLARAMEAPKRLMAPKKKRKYKRAA